MNCSQERFISDLVCKLKDLSFEDPQGPKTDRLNNEIADVAYNHKLCVWAKGLKDCKNPDNKAHISGHEWLYDLICFTYDEDEHYALNNTTFAQIVGTKEYTITINEYPKQLSNTNELLGYFEFLSSPITVPSNLFKITAF